MAEPLAIDAVEKRPNPLVTALAATPFGLLVPAWIAGALVHPAFFVFTIHLLLFGGLATFFTRRNLPFAKRVPVKLRVDDAGLSSTPAEPGAVETIPAATISRAVKVPSKDGLAVRVGRKGGRDREYLVPSERDADRVLEALGHDVAQTAASFRVMSRSYASTGRAVVTIFGAMIAAMLLGGAAAAIAPSFAGLGGATGMLALMLLFLWPAHVEVGGDGVLIRWLGQTRFIRHADIAAVAVTQRGFGRSRRNVVELELSSGEKVSVPTGAPTWDHGNAEILAARVRDARRASETGRVEPSALLMRSGRAHDAWVRALRTREVTDLRSPAVQNDHLWRVIEDSGADASERAAAVVALGPDLRDEARERLKRAAKVVAAPKLRVVLEDGPDASEEELAKMLEEVEVAAPKATQKRGG